MDPRRQQPLLSAILTRKRESSMTDAKTPVPMLTNDDDVLRDINSAQDVLDLYKDSNVEEFEYSDEFGTGFEVLETTGKARLVGVPFRILGFRFSNGDQGEFVSMHVVTDKGEKFIVNDGSTGIYQQCQAMAAKGKTVGIRCSKGLHRSDYTFVNDKGEKSPATTYYLR